MSTIRIVRNDAGNCINFYGASNPTYWNACLSASIDETYPDRINIRNDIRSAEEGTNIYEFYQMPYTSFVDKDGNAFGSPADAAQYITSNANVSGDTGTFIFNETDTIDAQREETNATVLFSNGTVYPVNSLQAVATSDGTITIRTVKGSKDIYVSVRYYNVTVNDGAITFNTLAAAVNRLNEVFTGAAVGIDGGAVEANAPTTSSTATFEVYGARITETGTGSTLGYTSTADGDNFDTSNGILSVQSISEAGEFFEFSQDSGDWTNAVGLTFGLFDETTYDRSDLESDLAADAVKAVLRLRVKNSGFIYKDPASDYGRLNESGIANELDTRTTFRIGLDADRRGYIAFQLANGLYENVGRTETAIASGTTLKFVAIFPQANELNGVRNMTVNTLIAGAPTLTWYYIETPEGSFHYPLFLTAEEANFVDEQYGTASAGSGSSHQEIFVDEQPISRTWFMPDTYAFENESAAPTLSGVAYNEISTDASAAYIPPAYEDNTVTTNEGTALNLVIKPAGDSATYSVAGVPSSLAFDGTSLTGTAPEVSDNNVNNPSDTYTITVTKANTYGSSVGTLTLVVNNLTQPATALTGFTWDNTSTTLVDEFTMGEGSVVTLDDTLEDGKRFIITEDWVETNVLPNLLADGDEVIIGAAASGADWASIADADFDFYMSWRRNASNQIISNLYTGSDNELTINSLTDAVYDYGFEVSGTNVYMIACNVGDLSSEQSPASGGSFVRVETISSYGGTIPLTLTMATISAEAGLSTSGISEIDTPAAPANLTSWDKAIDFSGSSERAEQNQTDVFANPLRMANTGQLVSAPSTAGNTVSSGHPWATTVVWRPDGNASDQYIWAHVDGTGTGSTDDNIYLRVDSNGILFFGMGRQGNLNEVVIGNGFTQSSATTTWYGVYIAHNGTRLSATDATATNLAAAFDIRIMKYFNPSGWAFMGVSGSYADSVGNRSTVTNWSRSGSTIGGRMDLRFPGTFTVGGLGSNNSFHGKVASTVVTTLRQGVSMPSDAEILEMTTDPIGWLYDYRAGNNYRSAGDTSETATFAVGNTFSGWATQVWLMGDGSTDSFPDIRNQTQVNDNYTKLVMTSMVSNDIVTVSISGLS